MKLKLGSITNMIVHYVGNKYKEEGVGFSKKETPFAIVENELRASISNAFEQNDMYEFYFEPDLNMNHAYTFVKTIFSDRTRFIEQSNLLAKILYEQSCIPQIKGGELCVVYMANCEYEGKKTDAIALLKVEKKQPMIQYIREADGFRIEKTEGINLSKIDKGCVIFNVCEQTGYKVAVVDNNSTKQTAIYWIDNFLHVRSCQGAYHQTKNLLGAIKEFVSDTIVDDKVAKAMVIARSKKILTDVDSISAESFAKEAFQDEHIAHSFVRYISEQIENEGGDITNISIEKKLAQPKTAMPSVVLHLDNNFDVKIYGGEDRIIQGYDENAGMNYYTLYYVKEK